MSFGTFRDLFAPKSEGDLARKEGKQADTPAPSLEAKGVPLARQGFRKRVYRTLKVATSGTGVEDPNDDCQDDFYIPKGRERWQDDSGRGPGGADGVVRNHRRFLRDLKQAGKPVEKEAPGVPELRSK